MKKQEKGITLIALIITIIVMLILVAVTINVALNGGIFDKAKQAKEDTQVETNKEAVYAAVVAAMKTDGSIDFTELNKEATKLGFTKVSDGVYTKDGNTYIVDPEKGKVTVGEPNSEGGNNQETSQEKIYVWNNDGSHSEPPFTQLVISANGNEANLYLASNEGKGVCPFDLTNNETEESASYATKLNNLYSLDLESKDVKVYVPFGSLLVIEAKDNWYAPMGENSIIQFTYDENFNLSSYSDAQLIGGE